MSEIKVKFRKILTYKGEEIFEMIKTKSNRYMLIDCKTNKIIGNTKYEILKIIKEFGIENNLK